MATALEEFGSWLSEKLQKLNTDENVFGSYIQGILDSDETSEEKREALREILSEIVQNETEINDLCHEIFEKWLLFKPKEPPPAQISSEEVDTKLVKLLESQSLTTTKQKQYTEEEKKIREAILSQYSQMTDDEEEVDETPAAKHPAAGEGKEKENGIEKNMNAVNVQQAEKIKREQAKLDSQKKKEKDKEDREKQKQQKEEKKEKRKTQKSERRR